MADGSIPKQSNLTRFQPRIAAEAAGTPLNRWQRQVTQTAMKTVRRRRLPKTVPPPPPPI